MKKTIIKYLQISLFLIVFCFCFASCKDNSENGSENTSNVSETKSLVLNKEWVSIDLYEDTTLIIVQNDVGGEVVWSSSNEDVATVENGVVQARGEGDTTVTATVGECTDTCVVQVKDSGAVPVICLERNFVEILKGDTATLTASVDYKGKAYSGKYTYRLLSGENYVDVSPTGEITAKAVGEATILVSANWRGADGLSMSETVTVRVKSLVEIVLPKTEYTVYTTEELEGEAYENQAELLLSVYENGEIVASDEIEWSIAEGEEYVFLSANVITGVKEGVARVAYYYETIDGGILEGTVNVVVKMPIATVEEIIYVEKYTGLTISAARDAYEWVGNANYSLSETELFTTGEQIARVEDSEGKVISDSEATIDVTTLAVTENTNTSWTAYTDGYGKKFTVVIADYILSDEIEFMTQLPFIYSGYVLLGKSLDFTEFNYSQYISGGQSAYSSYNKNLKYYPLGRSGYEDTAIYPSGAPFSGHFNGQGYSIKGITLYASGLFYNLKNAMVENFALTVKQTKSTLGILTNSFAKSTMTYLRNLYIEYDVATKAETAQVGIIAHGTNASWSMENCIVNVKDSGATETSLSKFGIFVYGLIPAKQTLDNVYFVYNGDGSKQVSISVGASQQVVQNYAENIFQTKAEYENSFNEALLNKWDKAYWDVQSGIPTFKIK